ncbi:pyridoxamine 5'-phosphate oxidase family protein [Streptomyces sp. NPDC048664]|uniref:pyridoxamine 5'-phosphate oxidase family protein n=1 Tax=Streptomyces sp. NPDC048664 TaxID=3154505 RepID=UPI003448BD0D
MPRTHTPRHHQWTDLDPAEALRLLGSVSLGRIVFTRHALPAVHPVNHILCGGDIVLRTREGTVPASHAGDGENIGVVVAYEADAIDPDTHLGWSVVAVGYARAVADPAELDYARQLLCPWMPSEGTDQTVRIRPELVTGIRSAESDPTATAPPAGRSPHARTNAPGRSGPR